jgi:hypothetical protein
MRQHTCLAAIVMVLLVGCESEQQRRAEQERAASQARAQYAMKMAQRLGDTGRGRLSVRGESNEFLLLEHNGNDLASFYLDRDYLFDEHQVNTLGFKAIYARNPAGGPFYVLDVPTWTWRDKPVYGVPW